MADILITVADQSMAYTSMPVIAAHGVNENYVEFTFDATWTGFSKVATFYNEQTPDSIYTSVVNGSNRALVPHEVTDIPGRMFIGVTGTYNDVKLTSEILPYQILPGSDDNDGNATVPPTPGIYEQILNEYQQIKTMIGSPLVANVAADMTDTTAIYVYTGSEAGYNSGHWYYWNGANWTDGGVYNSIAVQTDKTLTMLDTPADARALNFLNDYYVNDTVSVGNGWEQGSISSGNGANSSSTSRIRTVGYIEITSGAPVTITVPGNMKFGVYGYTAQNYQSFTGAWVAAWGTGTITFFPTAATYIRIVAAYNDDSTIQDSEGANITITQRRYYPLDNLYYFGASITSADDLDNFTDAQYGRWTNSNVPLNAPVNTGAMVISFVFSSLGAQIVITSGNEMYFRWKASGGWNAWVQVATV